MPAPVLVTLLAGNAVVFMLLARVFFDGSRRTPEPSDRKLGNWLCAMFLVGAALNVAACWGVTLWRT
jgi:hypothetical protein